MADTTSTRLARKIFGRNRLVLPAQVCRALRIGGSSVYACTTSIPTDPDTLRKIRSGRGGRILIPGPPIPMTLGSIQQHWPLCFGPGSRKRRGATGRVNPGWLIFQRELDLDTIGKGWRAQRDRVKPPQFIPNAAEVAWLMLVARSVLGRRLFGGKCVRTTSLASGDSVHRIHLIHDSEREIAVFGLPSDEALAADLRFPAAPVGVAVCQRIS